MRAILERGIGCDRAVVVADGRLVEAHLDPAGDRVGDVHAVRLTDFDRSTADPGIAERVQRPDWATEGALAEVEVTRLMMIRGVRAKLPRVRVIGPAGDGAADGAPVRIAPGSGTSFGRPSSAIRRGPDLGNRLAARGIRIEAAATHGPDRLAAASWSETIEMARTGRVPFAGGELIIERTAAFDTIDVDGHLPPPELALAAADAVGRAVRLFDLGGAIVIDFPTVEGRAGRAAVGEALDAGLPTPFERTAVNGFGLVQIVRPKARPSLIDLVQGEPARIAALELLRQAERAPGAGHTTITAHPDVAAWITSDLLAELERRTGRRAILACHSGVAIWGGHVHVETP